MATVPAAPRAFGGCGLSAAHRHRLFASRRFPLRCLLCAARTVPEKPRLYNINADGIFQIFGFQTDCVISAAHFLRNFFTPFSGWPLAMASIPSARLAGKAPLLESTAARSGASAPDITIILKAGSL